MHVRIQKNAQAIMEALSCPKRFACSSNGFAAILNSRRFLQDYFTCIGSGPECCPHSLHYGYECYCLCPLLNYVARELSQEQDVVNLQAAPRSNMEAGNH